MNQAPFEVIVMIFEVNHPDLSIFSWLLNNLEYFVKHHQKFIRKQRLIQHKCQMFQFFAKAKIHFYTRKII